MGFKSVKEAIRHFLKTNPVYTASLPAELSDEYPLVQAGILDSIGTYSLIIWLESTYKIKVELQDLDEKNFGTLLQIENFLKRKLA